MGAVAAAAQIGLWGAGLWKKTILWFLVSGLGLLVRFKEVTDEPRFFRQEFTRTAGLVAIIEYLANLASFALWVEIPLQALAVFCLIVKSGDRSDDDPKAVLTVKVAQSCLALFGLTAAGWTTWRIAIDWHEIDGWALLRGYLLPIWIMPVSLICVYRMAVHAAYQVVFHQMRVTAGDRRPLYQLLALTLRTAGRPSLIRTMRPQGSWRIGATDGFYEAWKEIGRLRLEAQERANTKSARQDAEADPNL
nr:hypothetical protein [bacterium]